MLKTKIMGGGGGKLHVWKPPLARESVYVEPPEVHLSLLIIRTVLSYYLSLALLIISYYEAYTSTCTLHEYMTST
eukprot:SAG11_NODE_879_length_6759_cov_5.103904_7_plen_75_part_00